MGFFIPSAAFSVTISLFINTFKGRAKSEDLCESQSFNLAALIRDMDLKVGEHGHETYCLKLASGV